MMEAVELSEETVVTLRSRQRTVFSDDLAEPPSAAGDRTARRASCALGEGQGEDEPRLRPAGAGVDGRWILRVRAVFK